MQTVDAIDSDLSSATLSDLAQFQNEIEEERAALDRKAKRLHDELTCRFSNAVTTPGTKKLEQVTIEVGKTVSWDQEQLVELQRKMRVDWDMDPAEVIDAKLSVSESRYKALPSSLQAFFTPARTVKAGKPKFTFTGPTKEAV